MNVVKGLGGGGWLLENQVVGPRFQLLFDLFSAPWLAVTGRFLFRPQWSDQLPFRFLEIDPQFFPSSWANYQIWCSSNFWSTSGQLVSCWLELDATARPPSQGEMSVTSSFCLGKHPSQPGSVLYLSGISSLALFLSLFFQLWIIWFDTAWDPVPHRQVSIIDDNGSQKSFVVYIKACPLQSSYRILIIILKSTEYIILIIILKSTEYWIQNSDHHLKEYGTRKTFQQSGGQKVVQRKT